MNLCQPLSPYFRMIATFSFDKNKTNNFRCLIASLLLFMEVVPLNDDVLLPLLIPKQLGAFVERHVPLECWLRVKSEARVAEDFNCHHY